MQIFFILNIKMKALLCIFIYLISALLNKDIDYKDVVENRYPEIIFKLSYSNNSSAFLICHLGSFTVSDVKLTGGESYGFGFEVVDISLVPFLFKYTS